MAFLGMLSWVGGDEAYLYTEQIITPFPASMLSSDRDNFKFYQSSLRIHIEQAFSLLLAWWRISRGGLNFKMKKCVRITLACFKLRNY